MMSIELAAADWWALLAQFLSLSLLAVGGAITTAPDMHRYLVTQQHWLSEAQFTSSIALAQAAPGPNVLFIALFGWQVGLNAAASSGMPSWASALLGVTLTMVGTLLPSTILTFSVARWGHRNRERRVKDVKEVEKRFRHRLLPRNAWRLIPFFELFMSFPND